MIVFDLICAESGHLFEGWFGSSDDFEQQKSEGLLCCPTCGSAKVGKALMAPNVGTKSNQTTGDTIARSTDSAVAPNAGDKELAPSANAVQVPAEYSELMTKLAKMQEKVLENSEWVGNDFSEKARAIHYGEEDEKPIHGVASAEEATELEEEGIQVAPLPLPIAPPKTHN